MTNKVENDISMKMYLLGELEEPGQHELEERLMTSNDCFEQLSMAEDKLVDEYLRGSLSAREEERFNDYFLCTPERNHALRFSRSLQRYVLTNTEPPQTVWGWRRFLTLHVLPSRIMECSLAAALSLIVLGGSWLTFRMQHLERVLEQVRNQPTVSAGQEQDLQPRLAQLRKDNEQLAGDLRLEKEQHAQLDKQLAALSASPLRHSSSSMVAFALTPGQVRDLGGMNKVTIPAGANWVQLQLDLGAGDYKKYQVVLQKEGDEISSWTTPKIKGGDNLEQVVLTLPAKLLPHGDYILKLSGIPAGGQPEKLGSYTFRVLQK
jgi:hypothetical protein